jgi:molybdopterin-binding protein
MMCHRLISRKPPNEAQHAESDKAQGNWCAAGANHRPHVRIDIGNGIIITSSITNEAIDDLGLAVGEDAIAVIKASDVMVAK